MQTIDVTGLPPDAVRAVESLVTVLRAQAAAAGPPPSQPPNGPQPSIERHLDTDYHAECESETAAVPTLEEVRAVLAKLPGNLTADFAAERDER